jgi:hypothetical protein
VKLGMASMKAFAPDGFLKHLHDHAELTNLPRIGTEDNVCFPTQQLNIAHAVPYNDSKPPSYFFLPA